MRALCVTLLVSCLALPLSSHAATLRCGTQLVSEGATPADVLLKCGEPMARQTQEIPVVREEPVRKHHPQRTVSRKTIEEWTYNFGPNRLVQVVVFEEGRLVEVKSAGYGR